MKKYIVYKEIPKKKNIFNLKQFDIIEILDDIYFENTIKVIYFYKNGKKVSDWGLVQSFNKFKPYLILHRKYIIKKLLEL